MAKKVMNVHEVREHLSQKVCCIAIIGATSDGKTTFRTLLYDTIVPNKGKSSIVQADASDVVRWGLQRKGKLGDAVRAQLPRIENGFYVTDDVMIPLFSKWLTVIVQENPRMRILLLSGFPRTDLQIEFVMTTFATYVVGHMRANEEILKQAFLRRYEESKAAGTLRVDDSKGLKFFNNRMQEYRLKTVPHLGMLNGNLFHLEREQPLLPRIRAMLNRLDHLDHSPLPRSKWQLIKVARERLKDPEHSVRIKITKIESPKPISAVPSESSGHAMDHVHLPLGNDGPVPRWHSQPFAEARGATAAVTA